MTRQFWSNEGKTEGSESLPYERKIHWTVKVSSGENPEGEIFQKAVIRVTKTP